MITALREQLSADLGAIEGVAVLPAWPDRLTVPCLFVAPPVGPMVTGGPTFGSYVVAMDVVVLVAKGSASIALEALESLVDHVLAHTIDWAVSGVDAPSVVSINGAEHLGTIVHLAKGSRL